MYQEENIYNNERNEWFCSSNNNRVCGTFPNCVNENI